MELRSTFSLMTAMLYTAVYSCIFLYTAVNSCILLYTAVNSCILLYTAVHSCTLLYTAAAHRYSCVQTVNWQLSLSPHKPKIQTQWGGDLYKN